MTAITSINQPYASTYVATYEPMIVEWLSNLVLNDLRNDLFKRMIGPKAPDRVPPSGGTKAPTAARYQLRQADLLQVAPRPARGIIRNAPAAPPKAAPFALVAGAALISKVSDTEKARQKTEIDQILSLPNLTVDALIDRMTKANVAHLLGPKLEQILSPIGIMHLYRQLYFDAGAALGPIEQVFAIAPLEVLEILQETTRRQTIERLEQFGAETAIQNQMEQTNTDEISDEVESTMKRDMSVGISAHGEGTGVVYSGGGTVSVNLAQSSDASIRHVNKQLRSVTKRSSETIRKSYTLSVRNVSEIGERSMTRRILKNELTAPINYALRRVMRKITVKVQSLGPRPIWQLHVHNASDNLARSQFVMFRDAAPLAETGIPPNAPERPRGGEETGTQETLITVRDAVPSDVEIPTGAAFNNVVALILPQREDRVIGSVIIENIDDINPSSAGNLGSPVVRADPPIHKERKEDGVIQFFFPVDPGGAVTRVNVGYKLSWSPSPTALKQWEKQVAAAWDAYGASEQEARFEREKALITAKSQIKPRPAADLRGEERYEIANRMVVELFPTHPNSGFPSPVEIELFNRYFDIPGLFYYTHPSWWKPRYHTVPQPYKITEDSEPAPFGSSLGWIIQSDGDRRRNEFLNSPYVRACIPIRPGHEHDAVKWLADHLVGQRGFDLASGKPLGSLLSDIESRRARERVATPGPDYVTLDGEPAPSEKDAAEAYPVTDQFDVIVPTAGFVYDVVSAV